MDETIRALSITDVLEIHEWMLQISPGLPGLSAERPLESVLNRVLNHIHYGNVEDVFEVAALYAVAIATGHAFNDGNKRTALAVMDNTLKLNGYTLPVNDDLVLSGTMVAVAEGRLSFQDLAQWLRENTQPF